MKAVIFFRKLSIHNNYSWEKNLKGWQMKFGLWPTNWSPQDLRTQLLRPNWKEFYSKSMIWMESSTRLSPNSNPKSKKNRPHSKRWRRLGRHQNKNWLKPFKGRKARADLLNSRPIANPNPRSAAASNTRNKKKNWDRNFKRLMNKSLRKNN